MCDHIESYRTYLVECYKQVKPPCVLDWPPQDELKYVTPTLITAAQAFFRPADVGNRYREVSVADVFALSKERSKNLVLLLGGPGTGKSTLSWFMSKGWAQGKLYQDYRLLIQVSFRDHAELKSAASLEDIVPHPDEESKRSVVQILKQTKGEGVAIIVDGYDEYDNECYTFSKPQSVVDILLQSIPKATLLLISRPADIVNRSLLQHSQNILSIWLSDFSREQVMEYFSKNSAVVDYNIAKRHFDEDVSLLGLCGTPINASIVLFLLHVCGPTAKLPSTQTELFKRVTINLLIRYFEDQLGFQVESPVKDFKGLPWYLQFLELCQQTHYLLFPYNFTVEDILDIPINGMREGLGLVTFQRLPNGTQKVTYMHLLFCDFFAAYYISTLNGEQQIAKVQYLLQHHSESPILSFLAGLTKLSNDAFSAMANFLTNFPQQFEQYEEYCLAKSLSVLDIHPREIDHRHHLFTLLKCVYESQRPELCYKIISRVGASQTRIGGVKQVYLSLSYYGITRFPQGCNLVGYFLGVIATTTMQSFKLHFSLVGNLIRDSGIHILSEQMLQTYKLMCQPTPSNVGIHIHLPMNFITCEGVSQLCRVAQQLPAITGLNLGYNWSYCVYRIFEEDSPMPVIDIEGCLRCLIESLASRTSSKEFSINIAGNGLHTKHIWYLLLLIMFSKNLTCLNLSVNYFGKLSIELIASALQHSMLKELHLDNCGITSLSSLGKSLEFNRTLEILRIQANPLSRVSLLEFFTQLRNNLSLARVWIDEWKDEYAEFFSQINTVRFHQGAMLLGCTVGQGKTRMVRPSIRGSLYDSGKFDFQQLFPQSLYGTKQYPGR